MTAYKINGKEYEVEYNLDNCPRSAHALRNRISSSGNAGGDLPMQTDAVITRRRDEVTGYYMYKYRHYSAELGRWPSRDPIEEDGGVNLYAFVNNQPTWYWDQLGLAQLELEYTVLEPKEHTWGESPGAVPVRSLQELVNHAGQKVGIYHPDGTDPCNCIKKLVIWTHGSTASLFSNDGNFDDEIHDRIKKYGDQIKKYKKRKRLSPMQESALQDAIKLLEQELAIIDNLELLGRWMCKNSSVQFYACEAGQSSTPLNELLDKYFPNSDVGEMPWMNPISPNSWPWSGDTYTEEDPPEEGSGGSGGKRGKGKR